jgi:hypothetical protein
MGRRAGAGPPGWQATFCWSPRCSRPPRAAFAHWDDRLALAVRYRPSGKTELSALLETSDRRYLGEAAQVLGTVPARRERVNAVGLAAGYRPHPRITLSLGLRRETRSTSLAFGDYAADVASVAARIGF